MQEAIDLWKINKKADELAGTTTAETQTELLDNLKAQGLITEDEYTILSEGRTITIGSREITLGKEAKTLVQAFIDGDLEIGDYVNYTPVAGTNTSLTKAETGYDGTQSYTVKANETNWQVLGLSEDGEHLLITTSDGVKADGEQPCLMLKGAESYIMCERTLNKICNIYKNEYAEEARSMTIDDINKVLGITVDTETNTVYKTEDETKTNIDKFGVLGATYEYKEGDYAPENYMIDTYLDDDTISEEIKEYIQEKAQKKSIGNSVTLTAYYYARLENVLSGVSEKVLYMLFARSDNSLKHFWLASPGVGGNASFGPGGVDDGGVGSGWGFFYSNGYWYDDGFGVRPVVSLNSKVTVDDIQEITTDEINPEEPWTDLEDGGSGTLTGTEGKLVVEATIE